MRNDATSSIAISSVSAPLSAPHLSSFSPSIFLLFHLSLTQCQVHNLPTNSSVQLSRSLSPFPAVQNVYVNINRIMSVGNRLLESGHYASQQIKQISGQLEKEWKAFAAALDERSTLLEMSASFHQKCDQVSRKQDLRLQYKIMYRFMLWIFCISSINHLILLKFRT